MDLLPWATLGSKALQLEVTNLLVILRMGQCEGREEAKRHDKKKKMALGTTDPAPPR